MPSSASSVSSTITIASAPGGMAAPVMIRTARPGATSNVGGAPAGSKPTTSSRTGVADEAPTVSTARTA